MRNTLMWQSGIVAKWRFLTARKYWNKLKQRLKEEGNETVKNPCGSVFRFCK